MKNTFTRGSAATTCFTTQETIMVSLILIALRRS